MSNAKRMRSDTFSFTLDEISDTELSESENSFTFSDGSFSFNGHGASSKRSSTITSAQNDEVQPEKRDATITLDDSTTEVERDSNDSVIVLSGFDETITRFDPDTDSILFAKAPPNAGNNLTPTASHKRKRKASSVSPENRSKRTKTYQTTPSRSASRGTSTNSSKRSKTYQTTPSRSASRGTSTNSKCSQQVIIENDTSDKPAPAFKAKRGADTDAESGDVGHCKPDNQVIDATDLQCGVRGHSSNLSNNNGNNPEGSLCITQTQSPHAGARASHIFGHGNKLICSNAYNFGPNITRVRGSPRPIVIDGSNVAMAHGNNLHYSCRGIKLCAQYFSGRGHTRIVAFVPQYRHKRSESVDTYILDELQKAGILKFTPSREVEKKRYVPYDDRYILQYAHDIGAIIVSNDNFRDLYDENPMWRETIKNRVLSFTWADENYLIFPQDPLGRNGPTLDQFLRF
jgi:ribonuclease ZC3H12